MDILCDFLGKGYIDYDICDSIIEWFESQDHVDGRLGNGEIRKDIKNTRDFHLSDDNLCSRYMTGLQNVLLEYLDTYPRADAVERFYVRDVPNIQRYDPPTGSFNKWHCERSGMASSIDRHLVYMTYLNDVPDEGATEFYHQKLKIYPEKGLTLIWPADWTFTHKGHVVERNTKYIVTGWFCFEKE
jgi:hypothetical protein